MQSNFRGILLWCQVFINQICPNWTNTPAGLISYSFFRERFAVDRESYASIRDFVSYENEGYWVFVLYMQFYF